MLRNCCCCWRTRARTEPESSDDGGDGGNGREDTSRKSSGNPRNKCALQPGHSLMDWIRLGNSGTDLTGVGARAGTLAVRPAELAAHCTPQDAWLAIRGRVYNVTAYMEFHPGGQDELMRGVGKDATALFNQVHAWVNFESILQKCFVGRLSSVDSDIDTASLFFGDTKKKSKPLLMEEQKNVSGTAVTNGSANSSPVLDAKLPRFDWIQKSDTLTLIFYTRPYCNPEIRVDIPTKDGQVDIQMVYDGSLFVNTVKLHASTHWPCRVQVNYETGKVEVHLKKIQPKIWEGYGTIEQTVQPVPSNIDKIKYIVIHAAKVNHNTTMLALQRSDAAKQTVPLGYHVRVFGSTDDEMISRSYTPIPASFMRQLKPEEYVGDLCLLVKGYPDGRLSPFVCGRTKGDVLELSRPMGTFELNSIKNKEVFLLLAAGTGITPMLGLITFLLERRSNRCRKAALLFFNRTESDILCRESLENLAREDERFSVDYVLSEAGDDWPGQRGHVDEAMLKATIDSVCTATLVFPADVFVCVCGPNVFTNLCRSLLRQQGYQSEHMHLFQG